MEPSKKSAAENAVAKFDDPSILTVKHPLQVMLSAVRTYP
jgi:hypothetical protein